MSKLLLVLIPIFGSSYGYSISKDYYFKDFARSWMAVDGGSSTTAAPDTGDRLVITGIIDGPLFGGTPKAVELYALDNIPDLSIYGVGSANNGGGTDGQEFTFPADSVAAGTFIYCSLETTEFNNWFGFDPTYTGVPFNANGDDAFELFGNGAVVDLFGDINTDGTGQPWEYKDRWAYRKSGNGQSPTFDLAEWTFSGVDAIDGGTNNNNAPSPFPVGTYTP